MKIIKVILSLVAVPLLFVLMYFSIGLIQIGEEAKSYKADYAELHSVKYGMFNSDEWTKKITKIVEDKIENFNININNRAEVESYIATIVDTLIIETERIVKERNKGGTGFFDSIMGSTKQMITDSIIDFKELRKRVPEFTATVMKEIEKPENQARAKKVLSEKFKEFMQNKFQATTDMSHFNAILHKYNANDLKTCTLNLDTHMQDHTNKMNNTTLTILGIAALIILLIIQQGTLNSLGLLTLASTSLILLITGIMLPMLDIEAKINKLYFMVLENPIVFENQILFFQSKSISNLLTLLLDSGEAKMIFVGILLVVFSIIFPTLKLIATTIYYYSKGIIRNHPLTRFFALYSTKWSMADVMVVSIFMAYLGLDGVVASELDKLENPINPVNIITTNGTHLEVGFFLFLGFVISSFVLSILVEKSRKDKL
jgi:hypothetical protein